MPRRTESSGAFTLIEMLVATALAAVLMAAVLTALAGVARDRQAMRAVHKPNAGGFADLIEWDLRNARTIANGPSVDAVLILVGNNGINPTTRTPDGRLVRVTYRTAGAALWRQQEFLDDPVRPTPWQECVTGDFRALALRPSPAETPSLVGERIRVDVMTGNALETREVTR